MSREFNPEDRSVEEWADLHGLEVEKVIQANNKIQREMLDRRIKENEDLLQHGYNVNSIMESDFICPALVLSINENKLIKALGLNETQSVCLNKPAVTCSKMVTLDLATVEMLGGSVTQKTVESAIDRYAETQDHNIAEEYALLSLRHRRKNVRLTLHEKYIDLLIRAADGRRVQTKIIEIALWKAYGGEK
jgi:hypothetical protein